VRTQNSEDIDCYKWLSRLAESMFGLTESVDNIIIAFENGEEVLAQGTKRYCYSIQVETRRDCDLCLGKVPPRTPISTRPDPLFRKRHLHMSKHLGLSYSSDGDAQ
jgi:hypothetical protein